MKMFAVVHVYDVGSAKPEACIEKVLSTRNGAIRWVTANFQSYTPITVLSDGQWVNPTEDEFIHIEQIEVG